MRPLVIKQDGIEEFFTEEKCFIKELLNDGEDPGLSFALARVRSGVSTALHSLKGTSEWYLIIAGTGTVEIGTLPPTVVNRGDLVLIPPDTPQRITNGGSEDLIFCCICSPGFEPSVYVDLE